VKIAKMVENLRTVDDEKFGKRRRGRGWPASKRVEGRETREVDKAKMHHCQLGSLNWLRCLRVSEVNVWLFSQQTPIACNLNTPISSVAFLFITYEPKAGSWEGMRCFCVRDGAIRFRPNAFVSKPVVFTILILVSGSRLSWRNDRYGDVSSFDYFS
jgi:hypothetical protein